MPDMVPGKARDFMLRVTVTGKNEIVFTGAEAFEGEEGVLEFPGDGETVMSLPRIATGLINAVVVVGCCGRDGARPFWFGGGLGSGRGAPPCRAKCATFRSLCTMRGCTPRKILVNHQATGWRFPNFSGMRIAMPLQIKGEVEISISP